MIEHDVNHPHPWSDESIVAATLQLLRDRGPAGVNVEAVAAASGVAKTVPLWRWRFHRPQSSCWPTRPGLVSVLPASAGPRDRSVRLDPHGLRLVHWSTAARDFSLPPKPDWR